MKKDVMLPIAYALELDQYFHISEKIPAEVRLTCPFCANPVFAKTGNIKQHHFTHNPDPEVEINCSHSRETYLHEGAKVFLYNSLLSRKPLDIVINDFSALSDEDSLILKSMGITSLKVTSNHIPGFSMKQHEMEKKLEQTKPDITSFDYYKEGKFAWEIYVTHELEENKKAFFIKQGIPFIELVPVAIKQGYNFYLHSFWGFDIFDKTQNLLSFLFEHFKADLLTQFNNDLEDFQLYQLKEVAQKLANKEADDRFDMFIKEHQAETFNRAIQMSQKVAVKQIAETISNCRFDDFVYSRFKKEELLKSFKNQTCITIFEKNTFANSDQTHELMDTIALDRGGKFPSVKINGYFPNFSPNLLASIFNMTSDHFQIKGLTNKAQKVIGFDFTISNSLITNANERVCLTNEEINNNNFEIEFLEGGMSKYGPFCCAHTLSEEKFYLKDCVSLLFYVLRLIKKYFTCAIILEKNKKGYSVVVGLKIADFPGISTIDRDLSNFCKRTLIEIVKKLT